jgi:hypothetical protein
MAKTTRRVRRLTRPKWVGQADKSGCAVACLAMVTGQRYWKVARHFTNDQLWDDGVKSDLVVSYLAEFGYAVCRRQWQKERRTWPPKPLSALHIAIVTPEIDSTVDHAVVWLADGHVLDPMEDKPAKLGDYWAVKEIMAVVKLD